MEVPQKDIFYYPRFSHVNTGNSWSAFTDLLRKTDGEFSADLIYEHIIKLCSILLPIDRSEAQDAIQQKQLTANKLIKLIPSTAFDRDRTGALISVIERNIFAFQDDLDKALPGASSYLTYQDPSFELLYPFYDALHNICTIKNETVEYYGHLDKVDFLRRVLNTTWALIWFSLIL